MILVLVSVKEYFKLGQRICPMSNNKITNKHKKLKSPYFHQDLGIRGRPIDGVSSIIREPSLVLHKNISTQKRLTRAFFDIPCVELAKALLGRILVRVSNGITMKGCIVETESYLGCDDKASISYGGRITEKSKPMYMTPGTTFVYLTYGMYSMMNISSRGKL